MQPTTTPQQVYSNLNQNPTILSIYNQIEQRETNGGGWAFHNYEHVKNVSNIAEKILMDMNFDEETIYKCRIACLLHDIGAVEGKEGHAERSYEYAKQLFQNNNWIFEGYEDVLDAIKNHSAGFNSNNIITLSIILADKLDIKKTRISEEGKKVVGNRQYGHIEDIDISIQSQTLTINFITDGNMDIQEANEYYFTAKVFKAIEAFSNKLELKYIILLDSKSWKI